MVMVVMVVMELLQLSLEAHSLMLAEVEGQLQVVVAVGLAEVVMVEVPQVVQMEPMILVEGAVVGTPLAISAVMAVQA